MEAPFSYTGGFGEAGNDFRAPFHKSVSQLSILTTARRMIDQGTYRSSACPYECTRRITRHQVVKSNEENLLTGLGLIGENFVYPGHADSDYGFSRFSSSGPSSTAKLRPMHMSHDVTLDQCDDIVQRHQLLAPHAVWMVNADHETAEASAERLGDCGLFLGARSGTDADIWRGFYRYARLVLRLGHFESWIDDDIHAAVVHSSSEGACNSGTSRVCLWWSEFDLDDEEYSCRPKRDASNIVTPATLLAALAKNDVAYPPPSPPPPKAAHVAAHFRAVTGRGPLPAGHGALGQVPQDQLQGTQNGDDSPRALAVLALGPQRELATVCGAQGPVRG